MVAATTYIIDNGTARILSSASKIILTAFRQRDTLAFCFISPPCSPLKYRFLFSSGLFEKKRIEHRDTVMIIEIESQLE